jgi:hypothetical protein
MFETVGRLLRLTIRYKSGFPRASWDFEALGAAIVGRSSPGIICPCGNANRQCRSIDGTNWTKLCTAAIAFLVVGGVLEMRSDVRLC